MTYLLNSTIGLSFMSFIRQAQQNRTDRVPLWIWILVIFLVVLVGIIWTLREEEEQKRALAPASPRPDTIPEPIVSAPAELVKLPPMIQSALVVEPTLVEELPPMIEPVAMAEQPALGVESTLVEEPKPIVPAKAAPPEPDDLKKIRGIGLKISQQLNMRGIYTFEQLANTDISYLERLMDQLDWHVNDPATWPEQARQLAEEKRRKQGGA